MIRLVPLLFLLSLTGCAPSTPPETLFTLGRTLGINKNHDLEETSGLAASLRHPGMLWAHNDSGHPAELFLLDSTGQTVSRFQIINAKNRDWEDIAAGWGPDSTALLFIGDTGDNREQRPFKFIYCIREPAATPGGEVTVADTLIVRFDDRPRDCEALLYDPLSHNLYLVSKREKEVRIYEVPYPYAPDTLIVEPVAKIPIQHITAGDISRDGAEILLKNYTSIYYWRRSPGQSVPEALRQPPVELAYEREPQGEAIAWADNGTGFYTLSENGKGERGRLKFYSRKEGARSAADTRK